MNKNRLLLLALLSSLTIASCNKNENSMSNNVQSQDSVSEQTSNSETPSIETSKNESVEPIEESSSQIEYPEVDLSYRVARSFEKFAAPDNITNEDKLPLIGDRDLKVVENNENCKSLVSGNVRLDFVLKDGKYYLQLVSLKSLNETAEAVDNDVMFVNQTPVELFFKGSRSEIKTGYDSITNTQYGLKAISNIVSQAGSSLVVEDMYYLAKENESGAFNFRRTIKVI